MSFDVVATGVGFCEGPVWRPEQQDLIVTSVSDGALYRVDVRAGRAEQWADTAGGPNGALLLDGGGILVAQNGGLDVTRFWDGEAPPPRFTRPGLQVVEPDGRVRPLVTDPAPTQPNDLAVDASGDVVFTDVLHDEEWTWMTGRLWRLARDGAVSLVEEVPHYLNGVSAVPGGLLTAEAEGLRWLRDGDRGWFSADCGRIDGFAADVDGRVYACQPAGGLVVVDPDGSVADRLPLPDGAFVTNCCFGGADLRTLFVADAGNAAVLAFESLPAPGHLLEPFRPTWTTTDTPTGA